MVAIFSIDLFQDIEGTVVRDWIIGLLLALFVIVPCWLGFLRAKSIQKQIKAWAELAQQTGLNYSPGLSPIIHGEYRGCSLSIFDLNPGDHITYQFATISIRVRNSAHYSLFIRAKKILDRITPNTEVNSGKPDFDRCFVATGLPQ